jgi:hypothetical protein
MFCLPFVLLNFCGQREGDRERDEREEGERERLGERKID